MLRCSDAVCDFYRWRYREEEERLRESTIHSSSSDDKESEDEPDESESSASSVPRTSGFPDLTDLVDLADFLSSADPETFPSRFLSFPSSGLEGLFSSSWAFFSFSSRAMRSR